MKKIIKLMMSPIFLNIIGIISLVMMLGIVIILGMIPLENFWIKIIATCYIVATMVFLVIIGTPKTEKSIGFRNISITSFASWCIIIPIIAGSLVTAMSTKLKVDMALDDVGFWLITIFITVFSFIWFGAKLYGKKDFTNRLDLYSTVWIAIVTILTTLYDLKEKKGAFVFLLAVYFFLQILIKIRICRMQEEKQVCEK